VAIARRRVTAELDAERKLKGAYERFMELSDLPVKQEAGKELVRSIFGTEAVGEDLIG
jgi:hypothetical protein